MSKENQNNIVAIQSLRADATPQQMMFVACQLEQAGDEVKRINGSLFGAARRKAVDAFLKHYDDAGKDITKMDMDIVRADFEQDMKSGEDWARSAECQFGYSDLDKKLPRTWIQCKSDLCAAISNGFNFADDPEASKGTITKYSKSCKEAAEAAAAAERNRKLAEKRKQNGEAPVDSVDGGNKGNDAAGNSGSDDTEQVDILAGLSPEAREVMSNLINGFTAMEAANAHDKVMNMLNSLENQAQAQFNKAMGVLARKAS